MNRLNQDRCDAFIRIGQYEDENPFEPEIPQATTLFTELATVATGMAADNSAQDTSLTGFRGGSDERRQAFNTLLGDMKAMNEIARGLDKVLHPGAVEQFRMPRSRSYQNIAARARAFVTNATGQEAIFTTRGFATGFLTAFTARVVAAEAAVGTRNSGLINRSAATASVAAKGRRGLAIVRELNAIIVVAHRNNAGLLAAWRTAKRVRRRAPSEEETPAGSGGGTTPPPSGGSGS